MAKRETKGVLGDETNPREDADVIVTAAIVGYSARRLQSGKNCAFATETLQQFADLPGLSLPPKIGNYEKWDKEECGPIVEEYSSQVEKIENDEIDYQKSWFLLLNAVDRINYVLGIPPEEQKRVLPDAAPNYGGAGVIWIVGGTGDLGLLNQNRHINSPDRSEDCGKRIYYIESDKFAGYKGPGAYTGMSARQNGESYIYSTFRGYPASDAGDRWLPSDPGILGYEIKSDDCKGCVSIWGIIRNNATAQITHDKYQMVYRDPDQKKEEGKRYETFVVGYTHGMIQAIYDVVQSQLDQRAPNDLSWGVPYEIGLKGKAREDPSTTKMASCFYCGLFMEANGKPASAIHLGAGDSWAPVYFNKDLIAANLRINVGDFERLNCEKSIKYCNQEWEQLCLEVLDLGVSLVQPMMLEDDHKPSLEALKKYLDQIKLLRGEGARAAANLILDSATVHDKIVVRVVRTLKPPGK
jgi:hypothetical protein